MHVVKQGGLSSIMMKNVLWKLHRTEIWLSVSVKTMLICCRPTPVVCTIEYDGSGSGRFGIPIQFIYFSCYIISFLCARFVSIVYGIDVTS